MSPLLTWVSAVLTTLIALLYAFCSHRFRYWKDRGVNGPTPVFLLGNSLDEWRTKWHERDLDRIRKYGRVFGIFQGLTPVLVVADPVLLQDILVSNFAAFSDRPRESFHKVLSQELNTVNGIRWKEMRSAISPAFASNKMRPMFPLLKRCIADLFSHMDSHLGSDSAADFNNMHIYGNLTLDIMARCHFSADLHDQLLGDNIFIRNTKEFFHWSRMRCLMGSLLPDCVKQVIRFSLTDPSVLQFLEHFTRDIVEKRGEFEGEERFKDQIAIMAGSSGDEDMDDKLTADEIIANTAISLTGGFDTTGFCHAYTTYLMAMHPEVQQSLRREVEEAVTSDGGEIRYESIMSLCLLDAVVNETLRLFPPEIKVERRATRDFTFSSGLAVEKGTKVYIPIYGIHHQHDFYHEPDCFIPERFMPANSRKQTPLTYLSFVAGPRMCAGKLFAMMEAKTTLAAVLMKYDLLPSERQANPLNFDQTTLIPRAGDIHVRYRSREAPHNLLIS